MANTDTNIWMWILLLSVVFYLYVDSRLNRIRTELLEHYTRIESMLTQNVLSGAQRIKEHFDVSAQNVPTVKTEITKEAVSPFDPNMDTIHSWHDVIPTKEEMTAGLKALRPTSPEDAEWCSVNGATNRGCGLEGFDTNFGAYAAFDIKVAENLLAQQPV